MFTIIPIIQVLHKLDISRRTSEGLLELSQYHIDFSPRKIIQSQALANFLVECSFPKVPDDIKSQENLNPSLMWILNVDGFAGVEHKGTGFILENPDSHQFATAMKFIFSC